jgi:hypothetical protein
MTLRRASLLLAGSLPSSALPGDGAKRTSTHLSNGAVTQPGTSSSPFSGATKAGPRSVEALRRLGDAAPSIGVAATIQGDYVSDLANLALSQSRPTRLFMRRRSPFTSTGAKAALDPDAPWGVVSTAAVFWRARGRRRSRAGAINGTGVGIAIVDSDIYPGLISPRKNSTTSRGSTGSDSRRSLGRDLGLARIAGLIASRGGSRRLICSERRAQRAPLVVFKVLDKNGAGSGGSVIAARVSSPTGRCSVFRSTSRSASRLPPGEVRSASAGRKAPVRRV